MRGLEFVEPVLAVIAPADDRKDKARIEIERNIRGLGNVTHLRSAPSPAALRSRLAKLAKLAHAMRVAVNGLPELERDHLFSRTRTGRPVGREHFMRTLSRVESATATIAEGLEVPLGSPHLDPVHYRAADMAFALLRFSKKAPTLVPDGPFKSVTRLLIDAATGKEEADVDRTCKRVYDERAQIARRAPKP